MTTLRDNPAKTILDKGELFGQSPSLMAISITE